MRKETITRYSEYTDPDTRITYFMGHDTFEEIVRCRDCKYKEAGLEPPFYCLRLGAYREFEVSLDDFCAWGKRKDVYK